MISDGRCRADTIETFEATGSCFEKAHTLKSQVAADEETGRLVDASDSVLGRRADVTLLGTSGLPERPPAGVGGTGGLGYVGVGDPHPAGRGASPRREPRGKDRPAADRRNNRVLSRRRLVVEHAMGRPRTFRAVTHVNRHARKGRAVRVRAIAGLVNRVPDRLKAA